MRKNSQGKPSATVRDESASLAEVQRQEEEVSSRDMISMRPEPMQTFKSEATPQERGATINSLEDTKATPALPPERPEAALQYFAEDPYARYADGNTPGAPRERRRTGGPRLYNGLMGQLITAGDMGGQTMTVRPVSSSRSSRVMHPARWSTR